ncbi:MAG: hypothetical protein WAW05_03340, partial [Corynebacterium casei]
EFEPSTEHPTSTVAVVSAPSVVAISLFIKPSRFDHVIVYFYEFRQSQTMWMISFREQIF